MPSLLASIAWATSGVLAVLVVGFYLKYLKAPTCSADEPPLIPYSWPYFGHYFEYMKDQREFSAKACARNNGEPFTLFFLNRKAYVFSKPKDTEVIYSMWNNKNHSQDDVKGFRTGILGFKSKDADIIAKFRVKENKIHSKFLLNNDEMAQMISVFNEGLEDDLRNVSDLVSEGPYDIIDGFNFVGETLLPATLHAFFGDENFTHDKCLFEDLKTFLTQQPGFLWQFDASTLKAREHIKSYLRAIVTIFLEAGDSVGLSKYNKKKIADTTKEGLSIEGVVSNEFDHIIASNINTVPMAYLALLHLYSDQALLAEIREEITAARWNLLSAKERAELDLKHLPKLLALFQEVMRLHAINVSIRELKEDKTIIIPPTSQNGAERIYKLKKGNSLPRRWLDWLIGNNIVLMPSSLLHHNPEIHENPDVFDAKRFLSVEHGGKGTPVVSEKLRPFGGGTSYCPGRKFAEKQIICFLAIMCLKFDISFESEGWEIPQNADFSFVASFGIDIKLVSRFTI